MIFDWNEDQAHIRNLGTQRESCPVYSRKGERRIRLGGTSLVELTAPSSAYQTASVGIFPRQQWEYFQRRLWCYYQRFQIFSGTIDCEIPEK